VQTKWVQKEAVWGGYNFYNKCIIQNSLDHHLAPSIPITNKKSFRTFQKFTRKYGCYIYTSPSNSGMETSTSSKINNYQWYDENIKLKKKELTYLFLTVIPYIN